jgi:hypothetical protein
MALSFCTYSSSSKVFKLLFKSSFYSLSLFERAGLPSLGLEILEVSDYSKLVLTNSLSSIGWLFAYFVYIASFNSTSAGGSLWNTNLLYSEVPIDDLGDSRFGSVSA